MMKVTINGKPFSFDGTMNIDQLLKKLGFDARFVAVARNLECIPRQSFEQTQVQDGDAIEVVAPMQGG